MSTALAHDDRARLAHRVLRLREAGIDSERDVRALAASAPAAVILGAIGGDEPADQTIAPVVDRAGIALEVVKTLEPDLPGPTDRKAVERLMTYRSLDDVWRAWDDAVTANVETLLDSTELKRWRRANADAQAAFEERQALMLETGDAFDVHPYFGHLRHTEGAANAMFDLGRQGFLDGSIDWDTATIKVLLVDSAVYTVNLATHQFASSIASVVATSAALGSKTVTAGVADSADATMTAVTGAQSEALVIIQSSAVGGGADVANTAQRLIAYIDTATGLPVTPNGGDITAVWDNGSNRIFKL